ncbi:hypothetical protein [Salipaludibacillus sp. CF4.18]|uniref:hypothetical protein n=1 Tax=Salipaludibacillus sp. CF4.18 TaxID=3373081 RepID=UPI003EE7FD8C
MEGKLVVQNAVLGLRRKVDYTNAPWVIYTNPEVFHLGNTEEELQEKKLKYDVFKVSLANVDRFVADHKTEGLVKILTNKRGYILGAHATGKGAGDFMQEVIFAKQYKKKIGDLSQVIHPYPNHAAAVQSTADLYWRKKLFEGSLPKVIKNILNGLGEMLGGASPSVNRKRTVQGNTEDLLLVFCVFLYPNLVIGHL